jgi:iron-sulfur cluster assembly accessory protein
MAAIMRTLTGRAAGAAAMQQFAAVARLGALGTGARSRAPSAVPAAFATGQERGLCSARGGLPSAAAGSVGRAAMAAWSQGVGSRGGRRLSSAASAGMVDVSADERQAVNISERCARRILKVQPNGFLRLRVDGGGCSGFQYKFELDSASQDDDVLFEKAGAKLVIDETSLDLVRGSTIDFVEEMISSSFQVLNNPQSESSCGCGSSFAPKA